MNHYVERVVDLLDPNRNYLTGMTLEAARERVASGHAESVREIDGSFALVAQNGRIVRLARSMDRPMRYFLAKRAEGPVLVVADRINAIHARLKAEGLAGQFHPSYTRMVPAHYVVGIEMAEGIPFEELTQGSIEKLYALKGEVVARGVKAVTGMDMPIFAKCRFQHGTVSATRLRERLPVQETEYRRQFLSLYA